MGMLIITILRYKTCAFFKFDKFTEINLIDPAFHKNVYKHVISLFVDGIIKEYQGREVR